MRGLITTTAQIAQNNAIRKIRKTRRIREVKVTKDIKLLLSYMKKGGMSAFFHITNSEYSLCFEFFFAIRTVLLYNNVSYTFQKCAVKWESTNWKIF